MIPEEMVAAFESCGIPYKVEGWFPSTPPRDEAYAVVVDAERITQDDFRNLHVSTHSYAVMLYSPDAVDTRRALRDALLANNVQVDDIVCNGNNQDTKLYETVFGIGGQYLEKWSNQP